MTLPRKIKEKITMPSGREVRRFILPPGPVRDGTYRCICCGQIDDSPWHDAAICEAIGRGVAVIDMGKLFLPIDDRAKDGRPQLVKCGSHFAAAQWTGDFWSYPFNDDEGFPYEIDFYPTLYWPKPGSAADV